MIHFDERRHHHSIRWPADEEPLWRKPLPAKPKKGNRKKAKNAAVVPKTIRIEVIPLHKSGLCRNVYWMHPNMAITRESKEKEEFVGEVDFYEGHNTNVIVNFFPALDYSEHSKLRFAHTAHTPPVSVRSVSSSASSSTSYSRPKRDYLQKNMDILMKKLDILAFKQAIIDSQPTN
ncbi:hypothetical protein GCK72_014732 [Caenorhabditis remanei]|uniref:Uncharacterized protein n=1 Tax=Caenorhabditis remanei TaxID=31234 RepID=A0A6A5GUE4_CAERE|nr:hypothetical protein GCK72_014732 [Caenorhabditis remanei]KAF1758274.1 hypothetical protein GCK72_014732 [Caenorhabditis remanei]